MPQSDPDSVACETLRLIGPDPQNYFPLASKFGTYFPRRCVSLPSPPVEAAHEQLKERS
jgi:hypothetical protein